MKNRPINKVSINELDTDIERWRFFAIFEELHTRKYILALLTKFVYATCPLFQREEFLVNNGTLPSHLHGMNAF